MTSPLKANPVSCHPADLTHQVWMTEGGKGDSSLLLMSSSAILGYYGPLIVRYKILKIFGLFLSDKNNNIGLVHVYVCPCVHMCVYVHMYVCMNVYNNIYSYRKCRNFCGHNILWVKFSRRQIFVGICKSSPL